MENFIDIDGSVLEGGGQILRISVSLSAILSIPIRVSNIRAGRSKPGLAAQHLTGLKLVADMCNGKLDGAHFASTEVTFIPGKIKGKSYTAEIGTAGSISLLLQVALPVAYFADNQVVLNLKGGTNVENCPQIDYMTEVFRPNAEKFGVTFDFDLFKRGYFPKGGGHVSVTARPTKQLKPVELLDVGRIEKVIGWSFVAGTLPIRLADEMRSGAESTLRNTFEGVRPNIECYKEDSNIAPNNCSGIILVCETSANCILGANGLGKRDSKPYDVGVNVAQEVCGAYKCGACVDDHIQDQIILFMALAAGKSSIRVGQITLHTKTAIYIAELLSKVKFNIIPVDSGNIIECTGLGYMNKLLH